MKGSFWSVPSLTAKLTIRETSAEIPVLAADSPLTQVRSLDQGEGRLASGFEFGEASVRALEVTGASLLGGRVRGVRAEQASIIRSRVASVEFAGCDLAGLRWDGGRISRTRFESCKLLGARFDGVTLEHVVFTGCKLDYATLTGVRAIGPVIFARCSLREAELAGCTLSGALFNECDLTLATFGPGDYRRCDLRGNDLSTISGARNLKRVTIDRAQMLALTQALAAELEVTIADD